MYVNIGQDKIIRKDDIIGIFDMDNTTVSKITRTSLNIAEKSGRAVTLGYDLPKSYIVCIGDDEKTKANGKIYISPLAPSTLTKRAQSKSGF